MNENDLQKFIEDISTELAGSRIDGAMMVCLKHGHRPAWYLLRKAWAGLVVGHRRMLIHHLDLHLAVVWLALLAFVMGQYEGKAEATPLSLQLALVLPFLGFLAMVAADRATKVKIWLHNRKATNPG